MNNLPPKAKQYRCLAGPPGVPRRNMIIALALTLASCNVQPAEPSPIFQYKCTLEQLKLVDAEMKICLKSDYFKSICYSAAKSTQCERIQNVKRSQSQS